MFVFGTYSYQWTSKSGSVMRLQDSFIFTDNATYHDIHTCMKMDQFQNNVSCL
jgi:hypothetical protein